MNAPAIEMVPINNRGRKSMYDLFYPGRIRKGGPRHVAALAAVLGGSLLLAGCEARTTAPKPGTPNPGPAQVVTLIPIGTAPNITWKVQFPGGPQQNPKTATTTIAQGTGPTKFTVNVAGDPQVYKFRTQDPLSVWAGPKDPPQSGIHPQIIGPLFEQGKLVFWDLNYGPAVTLSYAIHFENNIPSVDPIIENGGGSEQ